MAVVITQTANPAGVSASSTVATYSGVSIGTAASNRIVIVAVGSELASTPINSCTIDYGSGDTAMTAGSAGNFGAVYARLFYLLVPTGTTATIKVTWGTNSPTSTQNHIAVYTATDAAYSSAGNDGSTDMDSTDPLTTGSTTIASGGGMIAVAAGATDTAGKTWANLTEDIDADAGALRFTTAYSTSAGTATRTCTGATNGEDGALSWIIFADNSSPTVSLNSPADSATGVSTTPDLVFTGTDGESDDVRYEVQVNTVNNFPPIVPSNLTSGQDTDGNSSATTASISPTANALILVSLVIENTSSTNPTDPSLSGNGITWTLVNSSLYDSSSTSRRKVFVFKGLSASPSSGAISITLGEAEAGVLWSVDQFIGVNTSSPVVQSGHNEDESTSVSSITVTLSAFAKSSNMGFGAFGDATGSLTHTAGSGFTKYGDVNASSPGIGLFTEANSLNDNTVDGSLSANDFIGAVALEINAATSTIDAVSGTDAGFSGSPDNTDPFASGQAVTHTVQSALSNSTLYYWRVRGIDPSGSNTYGAWATTRSFTTTSGGTNVTVNADVVTATSSLQSPTVSTVRNITVTADLVTATSSLPTPTVSTVRNISVAADVQSITASLQTPTVSTTKNVTVAADVVTGTISVLAPTVTTVRNVTVSADVVSATLSQQAPTVSTIRNISVAANVVSITESLIDPDVSTTTGATDVTVNADIVSLTESLQAPTVTTVRNISTTADVVSITKSLSEPTVSTIRNITVLSDVVSLAESIQSPSVDTIRNISINADIVSSQSSLLSLSIQTTGNVSITPSVLSMSSSLLSPTITTGSNNVIVYPPCLSFGRRGTPLVLVDGNMAYHVGGIWHIGI